MRLSFRSHVIFFAGLVVATFGAAQIWSLTAYWRDGGVTFADILMGVIGVLLLAASGLVVGRILYQSARAAEYIKSQIREAQDESAESN